MSYCFIIKSGDIYVKLERCMLGYGNRQEARRHLIELHYAWASVYAPTESNNQVSIWPLINFFFSHLSYVSIPTKSYKMKSYWFSNDSLLPHIKELWYQIRAAFQILWKIIWLQIWVQPCIISYILTLCVVVIFQITKTWRFCS